MKQGISDDFLKVIFNYRTRQAVSLAISTVRECLMGRFVFENIGFNSITRQQFIDRHITDFANQLYNPDPDDRKAIVYIDGTYSSIQKSSNFQALRQSFCVHKGKHLVKPILIVATNGYILDIHGPYFSDHGNNDASIMTTEFQNDMNGIRRWFQEGDIFIVDRGYRDAIGMMDALGLEHRMPCSVRPGQRQLSTEEANESRLVTKTRWIVEARNGHFKSKFKFFSETIIMPHVIHFRDFYRICGAIINKYCDVININEANVEMANMILDRSRLENGLKQIVLNNNLDRRYGRWSRLTEEHIPNFPRLDMNYLRDLTVGTYQLRLAASYVQDTQHRERGNDLHIDEQNELVNTIRIRVFSRHRNNTKYQLWIRYQNNGANPITGYYCTCKSGARTLGACAHVSCVFWFLGYSRHEPNVVDPTTMLLENVLDVQHRHN